MKRDIDLIRNILLTISDEGKIKAEDTEEDALYYHLYLLIEAGYVNGKEVNEGNWQILGLTWEGHELLELIRDYDRWQTIIRVLDDLNCYSFEIVKRIAINAMKL